MWYYWIAKDVMGLNIRAGCSIDTWYSYYIHLMRGGACDESLIHENLLLVMGGDSLR